MQVSLCVRLGIAPQMAFFLQLGLPTGCECFRNLTGIMTFGTLGFIFEPGPILQGIGRLPGLGFRGSSEVSPVHANSIAIGDVNWKTSLG